ncbi:TonB-dependent receptor [Sphingomonas sp.]|uniref:TonB-dependent receptor n=1 Tax=Sphingomonas sp. TaxID=28214 RepID=UPI0025F42A27|nr:TonB-dependent receptor [Sphingomonas sp.]
MVDIANRVWRLAGGVSLLALVPTQAYAQEQIAPKPQVEAQAADQSQGVGDIVVTAQKRSERINDVGISITALSGDALRNQGITQISDLTKVVPGLNYTRSSYGAPVFTIRGIGFNETSLAAAPTVTLYLDEVPLPFPLMSSGTAFDLQRVEVLKGPQGTLFGQNSTGGAINFIANKPTRSLEAGFDLTLGRFDQVETTAYVSGPLTSNLRARLAVKKDYSGPWQQSSSRNDELGKADRVTARLLIDWDATDRLTFNFNANGWQDRSDTQAGQLVGVFNPAIARVPLAVRNYPLSPETPRAADWDPNANLFTHDDFYQGSVRASYDFGNDLMLTSITAYEKLKRSNFTDADGMAIQNFSVFNHGFAKTFTQELRLSGRIDNGIRWVVGANYQHDNVSDATQPRVLDSSFPFDSAEARSNNKVDTYAGFANVDWEVAEGLTLQGGVRYTDQKRAYEGCLYDLGAGDVSAAVQGAANGLRARQGLAPIVIPPGSCVTLNTSLVPAVYTNTLKENNVSWRTGINWKINSTSLLYANISRGYKNGNFPTTGATFSLSLFPATQESVTAYEAGFKLGLLNRTVQLNGAVFYYDYQDKQIRGRIIDPTLGGLNQLLNIPKSHVEGAELQLAWQPVSGLTLNGGATYVKSQIDGNFTNFTGILRGPVNLSGQAFPLTPKWQLTGDAQYDVPVSGSAAIFAGVGATYQSATNAALGDEPLLAIKAYTLVDLRAGIHAIDDTWRISGFVKNLTNEYYWTNVVNAGADVAARYAGRPRTYGVTLSYRYR